jgi:hypothetical protein
MLEEMLSALDEPTQAQRGGIVARLDMDSAAGAVGYFRSAAADSGQVGTLRDLHTTLDSGGGGVQLEDLPSIKTAFGYALQERRGQIAAIDETRRRSALSSVQEEIRQLLLESAYIELAKAAQPDLFDDLPSAEFSVVAIENLKRHGYPFKGATRPDERSGGWRRAFHRWRPVRLARATTVMARSCESCRWPCGLAPTRSTSRSRLAIRPPG